jgi:hypothetical protein
MDMPLDDEKFKEHLSRLIRDHYELNPSTPLLLSHLGARLDQDDAWPENREGRSLKRLLEAFLSSDFDLVSDPHTPAFIAAPRDLRPAIEAEIEKRQHRADVTGIRPEDISRAVLLAFCVGRENKPVFIRRSRPFKYELDSPPPGAEAEYIPVEPEFRMPGLRIDRLSELDRAQREKLLERVHRWADAHHVELEQFAHRPGGCRSRVLRVVASGM